MAKKGTYHKFREKTVKWLNSGSTTIGEFVFLPIDILYYLFRIMLQKKVKIKYKIYIILALLYYLSPIDLIPEGLFGPIGILDDLIVIVWMLNAVFNTFSHTITYECWAGKWSVFQSLQVMLWKADSWVGVGLLRRFKKK